MSTHNLTDTEISALKKGLKYIPTPKRPNRIQLLHDANKFIRKMRLRYIMRHKQNKKYPFKMKFKWIPYTTENTTLENYPEATKLELANIPFQNTQQNITRAERIALKTLSKNKEITIKPFDKGRNTAVLNTIDYISECERQLSDQQYYTKLPADDTEQTIKEIRNLTTQMYNEKHTDYHSYVYLNPSNTKIRTPCWYLLPKIHKTPPNNTKFVGLPIISGCSSPTFHISEFIDHFLEPIVQQQPTYIKYTPDIIRKLEAIKVPNNATLLTLDIVSMYTNTPHNKAIQAVGKALNINTPQNEHTIKKPPAEIMLALLTKILAPRAKCRELCQNLVHTRLRRELLLRSMCGASFPFQTSFAVV